MTTFPVYLLKLGDSWQVVFPEKKEDISHTDFWEQTVSCLIAAHYRIPQAKLLNLPYSQRRARIVENVIYYGEKPNYRLLQSIRKTIGNDRLSFVYDNHEKRLKEDVLSFRRLVRGYSCSDQNRQ